MFLWLFLSGCVAFTICLECLSILFPVCRGTYRLKESGWKKIFHANGNQKKVGIAILTSDKIDFKIKTVTRDKEGHYIMIKGSVQED